MPEIGEVARAVHYIKENLVGRTLAVVKAQHDENVFGKVGTSAAAFEKAMSGKKIVDAQQQGKYFWLVMSSPPHPLMHFGMTGWFKLRHEETYYYKRSTPPAAEEDWPPRFWKFILETAPEDGKPKCEAAFVDSRRFARVRLIDCPADEMRKTSPLVDNGPDPVIDKDILTEEWLAEKCASKKMPIKALLLDQANISGIGNWVGDEILYDAKMHPEQYSNTLSRGQIAQLHKSLVYVTSLAVETKADSSLFPDTWLFKHRWGKGKKDSPNVLPNGARITFLTVGGRTSAVVPSIQKKTGRVAGNVKDEEGSEVDKTDEKDEKVAPQSVNGKPKSATKKAKGAKAEESEPQDTAEPDAEAPTAARSASKKRKSAPTKATHIVTPTDDDNDKNGTSKRRKTASRSAANAGTEDGREEKAAGTGRRRSARRSAGQ